MERNELNYFHLYFDDDDNGGFTIVTKLSKEELISQLDKYREFDPEEYNNIGFIEFLASNGHHAEILEPEYIYF